MKSFRRSVLSLFLVTFLLLLAAWVGMKAMQYEGDLGRMTRDFQRSLGKNAVVVFIQGKAIPFFREKVVPAVERVIHTVKGWFR